MRYLPGVLMLAVLVFTLSAASGGAADGAEYEYSFTPAGSLTLRRYGVELFTTQDMMFGPNWSWAPPTGERDEDGVWRLQSEKLGVRLTKEVMRRGHDLVFTIGWEATKDMPGANGGGFEWQLNLPAATTGRDPQLLPDNTGWRWQVTYEDAVTVTFEPALERVFFEQGRKNTIRTFFYSGDLHKGEKEYTMTVSLPEGARSLDERYGEANTGEWMENPLALYEPFVDLSDMNEKPAGGHGFVRAAGGRFVFEDGTPARFWGCNIQAYSIFVKATNPEEGKRIIEDHARRIAALGFNLVRLHHHDSKRWVKKCLIADGPTSQRIDPEALDSYFYWIKCLRDQGIYAWIDLHTGRPYKRGDDIPGWDEIADGKDVSEAKGFTYINERLTELIKKFNEKLLTTENPYTGLALVDDPAVMGMMLVNENDLTSHFGNRFNADKNNPIHHAKMQERVAEFCEKWGLDRAETSKFWLPGTNKLFLNTEEAAWYREMIDHLHDLGVKVPVTGGHIWGGQALYCLPALTAGDIIDTHSYEPGDFISSHPAYKGNAFTRIVRSNVADMPLAISEYNASDRRETRDPFTVPLYAAVLSAFQGIDAPMLFAYSQDQLDDMRYGGYLNNGYKHPAIISLYPAAALLYRRDVSPARRLYVARLGRENAIMAVAGDTAAFRTLQLQHGLRVAWEPVREMPWMEPTAVSDDAVTFTDLTRSFLPEDAEFVESDTGELRRDWARGLFTIDTPGSQGASGWLGEQQEVALSDVSLRVNTPKATVIVSSLDGRPIGRSGELLISSAARTAAVGPQRWNARIVAEPVTGSIAVRSRAGTMTLSPLKGDGTEGPAVPLEKRNGAFTAPLRAEDETLWWVLRAE